MAENNASVLDDKIFNSTMQQMTGISLKENGKINYRESPSYLPFNDYFMSLCLLTGARSKDPVTKVGACIVSKDNRVLSVGYNGMPSGVNDYDLPWDKHSDNVYETKYPYVCHAEMNAIMNLRRHMYDLKDCCMYVSKFPCPECAKLIIQSGLRSVVYAEYKQEPFDVEFSTKKMFQLAGVVISRYAPSSIEQIHINIVGENAGVSLQKLKV